MAGTARAGGDGRYAGYGERGGQGCLEAARIACARWFVEEDRGVHVLPQLVGAGSAERRHAADFDRFEFCDELFGGRESALWRGQAAADHQDVWRGCAGAKEWDSVPGRDAPRAA